MIFRDPVGWRRHGGVFGPFVAWLRILALLPVLLTLCLNGYLSVEAAGGIFIVCMFLEAFGVFRYRYILAVLGLLTFLWQQSGEEPNVFAAILGQVFTLSLVLLGFYVMFGGLFRLRRWRQ